jgi:hypothetical protein
VVSDKVLFDHQFCFQYTGYIDDFFYVLSRSGFGCHINGYFMVL